MGFYQSANIRMEKIDCLDSLGFQGLHLHKHDFKEILSADDTMNAADNGKVILCDTTLVITLPSAGAGYGPYTFVNYGDEHVLTDGIDETPGISDVEIFISPNASDQITGCDISASGNKDLINTLETAKRGDYIKIQYAGANKWAIVEMRGTWARE